MSKKTLIRIITNRANSILDKPTNLMSFLEHLLRSAFKNKKQLTTLEKEYISLCKKKGGDYWHYKFRNIHPELSLDQAKPKKLRLILGIACSGTTWIGRMLATTLTSLRYFEEPLFHIIPKLSFTEGYDHTAIHFYKKLADTHRLVFSYKMLTIPDYDWDSLGLQKFLRRDDKNFDFCLVKEVHSLLATEALLNKLKVPAIIVIRNPLYIVDSLFDRFSLSVAYLNNEANLILEDPTFLNQYFSKTSSKIYSNFAKIVSLPDERRKIVQQKILVVAVITKMLECLAKNSKMVGLMQYEKICKFPQKNFSDIAAFLDLAWGQNSVNAVRKTTNYKGKRDKSSIKRYTPHQISRPFRFLTIDERKEAKEILENCKLDYLIRTF